MTQKKQAGEQRRLKPDAWRAKKRRDGLLPVTVVIPTYNRAVSLGGTLSDLMAQDYDPALLEIVVVDNSSSDNTEDIVRQAESASPFPLHYYRKENRGPAVSRNYGIEMSAGQVIAFTDSDCRIPPDWVSKGVGNLAQGVGFVAGPVRPVNNPQRLPTFFAHQTDHGEEDYRYATANVFYPREVISKFGGFNERYGTYPWGTPVGGEDTELAWRVKRAGYRAVFAPDNPVYHEATDMTAIAWLLEPMRAQILPHLVKQYPELREKLWCRYFNTRSDALFCLAVAGLLAAASMKRPAPLLLVLPWIWNERSMVERDMANPRRWWRMPVKYALTGARQVVQTSALLVSSVRYRTPVL